MGSHQYDSYVDNIVALAGGARSGAPLISAILNRVKTVASSGDSVIMPASVPGANIAVVNAGVNPMQVFAQGSDTINGIAGATGVSQMQNSVVWYQCESAGAWQAQGLGSGFSGGFETYSTQDGMVAHAGGGQGSATPITVMQALFGTVTTTGDSAILPAAKAGMEITVVNKASNSMNVFPAVGETINNLSANTALAVAGANITIFYCGTAGAWWTK